LSLCIACHISELLYNGFWKEAMTILVCCSTSVPIEVTKHCKDKCQYTDGVKSSTALILECRPWLVIVISCYKKAQII